MLSDQAKKWSRKISTKSSQPQHCLSIRTPELKKCPSYGHLGKPSCLCHSLTELHPVWKGPACTHFGQGMGKPFGQEVHGVPQVQVLFFVLCVLYFGPHSMPVWPCTSLEKQYCKKLKELQECRRKRNAKKNKLRDNNKKQTNKKQKIKNMRQTCTPAGLIAQLLRRNHNWTSTHCRQNVAYAAHEHTKKVSATSTTLSVTSANLSQAAECPLKQRTKEKMDSSSVLGPKATDKK